MPGTNVDWEAPRGPRMPYTFFVKSFHQEYRKQNPGVKFSLSEISRHCGKTWKGMSVEAKQKYIQLSIDDRNRYAIEMEAICPSTGETRRRIKRRRRKGHKDPHAPKRTLSAFFWYSIDHRHKIKEANPGFRVSAVAKELGRMWSQADPNLKQKYKMLADQDKARYKRELEAYKEEKRKVKVKYVKKGKSSSKGGSS